MTDSAQAGPREAKAIAAALAAQPGAPTTTNATASQLAAAVSSVISANPKFKAGIVAGEALKTPAAVTNQAGAAIANAVITAEGASLDRVAVTADGAKTAGLGKSSNVTQVDEYAALIVLQDADAIAAAIKAKASRTGVAAIFQGRSSGLTDAQRTTLANSALDIASLRVVGQAVAVGTSLGVANPQAFAVSLNSNAPGIGDRIASGVVATHPTDAAAVVEALYNTTDTLLDKQVSTIAKAVAFVADIEQISNVALVLGRQIGNNTIKTNKAASLAKTLTAAIVAKGSVPAPNPLSIENKADEVAEVAAFIVAGLNSNSALTATSASKLLFAVIKSSILGGKAKKNSTALPANYIADVAGSVAITVRNSAGFTADEKTAIQAALLKKSTAIAGKSNKLAIEAAINGGFLGDARYEDGNNLGPLAPGELFPVDPETDDRGYDDGPVVDGEALQR